MSNADIKWMRISLTLLCMLTVAPLAAVIALIVLWPDRWANPFNPLAVFGMWFFGFFTTPLWPTFIPAVFLTPWIMGRVAKHPGYSRSPLMLLLVLAMVIGALAGVCVMSPLALLDSGEPDTAFMWMGTGAVSGAVTLTIVALLHRYQPRSAQQDGAGNSHGAGQ